MRHVVCGFILGMMTSVTGAQAGMGGREMAAPRSAAEVLGLELDEGASDAQHPLARTSVLRWSPPPVELLNGWAGIVRSRPMAPFFGLLQAPEEQVWDDESLDHSA